MGIFFSCCSSEGYEKLDPGGDLELSYKTQPADIQDLGVPTENEIADAIGDLNNDQNLDLSDDELDMFLEKLKTEDFKESKQ